MACCIALTVLVSLARGTWFLLTGTRPAEVGFAPPARRPAPNAAHPMPAAIVGPQRTETTPQPLGHQLIVVGLAWFVIGIVGMHAFGWFDWAHASVIVDIVFHSSGIWLATWGAALLYLQRRPHPTEVTA
jgi:hypothetical protein